MKAMETYQRRYSQIPLFDPTAGQEVVAPPGKGPGNWAGAPSVLYDQGAGKFYLYYRLRRPRGQGRGFACRVAESTDGLHFHDIWEARKEELATSSLERGCLYQETDGSWRLYLSYVDPADQRWRVDLLEAASPKEFDLSQRHQVLTAAASGVEGVKDPYVVKLGGLYYMFLSYAPSPREADEKTRNDMHATSDVFNTGITTSETGLALSADGRNFRWVGGVLAPGKGWDRFTARITSVLYQPPIFHVFYDGSASVQDNYEEQVGLAISFDLQSFRRVTEDAPLLVSPHGSGSVRYLDVIEVSGRLYYYYEFARPDGSHDLRVEVVRRES